MKENVLEARKRYESEIDTLKISNQEKDNLKRVLKGIIESSRGRLFTKKTNSFEEYLTLRPTEYSTYEFCVFEKMINEYSGATEGSKKTPLSLTQFSEYVKENQTVLESEVINAENHQKRIKMQEMEQETKKEEKPKTPQEEFKEMTIARIEEMRVVPEHKKQRAIDVLEAIAILPQNKLISKRENDYSEAISLRPAGSQLKYGITKRMTDYAGGTSAREFEGLGINDLLEYIEENRIEIDRSIRDVKRRYPDFGKIPEKEKRVEAPDDDGR